MAGGVAGVGLVLAISFLPAQPPTAMFDGPGAGTVDLGDVAAAVTV